MAFEKQIYTSDNTGVSANYWKITQIDTNWINKIISIKISGFLDEQSRMNNKSEIMHKQYTFDSLNFDNYFSVTSITGENLNILSQAYKCIKALDTNEFGDALDV